MVACSFHDLAFYSFRHIVMLSRLGEPSHHRSLSVYCVFCSLIDWKTKK
jgi:hypothetical protein